MKYFPLDCTTECPHYKTWDMSVDDWTSVCDVLKVQVDDCDGDYIRYRCPFDSDRGDNTSMNEEYMVLLMLAQNVPKWVPRFARNWWIDRQLRKIKRNDEDRNS